MICFPNAKINLGLSIVGKRNDGMHDIESCLMPIPIYDILELNRSDRFKLVTMGEEIDCAEENNLISVAMRAMQKRDFDIPPVEVILYKNIPIGSGLGGGSSDAAYFLKMLNSYFSLDLSDHELEEIAADIGSDCPFFIKNKAVIATGTGTTYNEITNPLLGRFLTVVYPGFSINTKNAYSKIDPKGNRGLVDILLNDSKCWKNSLVNDFEVNIMAINPQLKYLKEDLYKAGAYYVSLTGSGSALFALSDAPLTTDFRNRKYRIWNLTINQIKLKN